MPAEYVVPPTFPTWLRDTGAFLNTTAMNRGANIGNNLPAQYNRNVGGAGTIYPYYGIIKASAVTGQYGVHSDTPCLVWNPTTFISGYWMGEDLLIQLATEWSGAVTPGDMYKVWIDEMFVAFETPATLSIDDKVLIYTFNNSVIDPNLIGVGGNQFGIRADGAGGFDWFSADGGVQNEAVSLTWPQADLARWVRVRFEFITARSVTQPASMNLYLDNTLVISRAWGPGTVLPDYGSAGTPMYIRRCSYSDAGSTDMYTCMWRSRAGEFTAAGVQIR